MTVAAEFGLAPDLGALMYCVVQVYLKSSFIDHPVIRYTVFSANMCNIKTHVISMDTFTFRMHLETNKFECNSII